MNQGIYGFPFALATSSIISITDFDASGTYTIPSEASELEVLLVGGGGGGGGGARSNGTGTIFGGGAGGGGGAVTYVRFYTKDLQGRNTLNITIGQGGQGGSGRFLFQTQNGASAGTVATSGGNSYITIPNYAGFIIQAIGGAGGGAGATANAAGAAAGGVGRNFLIASTPAAMESGAVGSSTSQNQAGLTYSSFRSNGGAGGGSPTSTTVALTGGSIKVARFNSTTTDPLVLNLFFAGPSFDGFTAAPGGRINGGNTVGKGTDGINLYKTSAGTYLFGGFGGAGGGAGNTVGGGNGGDGYRGGGGGGGGGVLALGIAAGLALNQVPSGTGGNGGNGYCRIVARR